MTQSYYGGDAGGDLDNVYRPYHRSMNNTGYYDRAAPYGLYDQQRRDLRMEYGDRSNARGMMPEHDNHGPNDHPRRRVAVAVRINQFVWPIQKLIVITVFEMPSSKDQMLGRSRRWQRLYGMQGSRDRRVAVQFRPGMSTDQQFLP